MTNLKAVNWNRPDDEYTEDFLNQNFMQIWREHEIPLDDDKMSWITLTPTEQDVYKKVLGGLTFLDTEQGAEGMPLIMQRVESPQRKAVLGIMGAMEHIHAKSYSSIFATLVSTEESDKVFEWADSNPFIQRKGTIISGYYRNIQSPESLYMAMVASVFLESALFYSGFYYPLLLAGHGKMTASGEIIDLIMRDEAVHGQYIGTLAREVYGELPPESQAALDREVETLLRRLYDNEAGYTVDLYAPIGLEEDVLRFLRYNFNRALMNLGRPTHFPDEEINPVVLNGIDTSTKIHDFFSKKGNGYQKAVNIVPLTDADFCVGEAIN
ncbi:class 1b ribonucleoside-diphosphate reductase subunit beta [Paenibacillus polymyxa]|uniref:class 1b ribonucleoside-diphosphate reductase subunit beta n=1 Tax=Paenibacillus polymyxa TaxID=1406 RepID=UPI0018667312|nr:class 1b ribonucleoside-diphosphate reductase subunit beta [Paenibacillus polymyxa]MBE3649162.1 class 1b ribonucleoside-diphosphate reductase subunit beta [Paenibacillus polymyxa]